MWRVRSANNNASICAFLRLNVISPVLGPPVAWIYSHRPVNIQCFGFPPARAGPFSRPSWLMAHGLRGCLTYLYCQCLFTIAGTTVRVAVSFSPWLWLNKARSIYSSHCSIYIWWFILHNRNSYRIHNRKCLGWGYDFIGWGGGGQPV